MLESGQLQVSACVCFACAFVRHSVFLDHCRGYKKSVCACSMRVRDIFIFICSHVLKTVF